MADLPILYSFRRCPYAIRARLALKSSGVRVALREVALRAKPAGLLALSPKGTVPVLDRPGEAPLQESIDIMDWALAQSDPQGWRPADEATAAAEQALVATNDGPFKRLLDLYKYAARHPEHPEGRCRDEAVDLHLAPLDHLLATRPCLRGDRPGRADMALLPFVRQFALVDEAWFAAAPLASLRRWLSEQLASDVFIAAMHDKLPPWQPGDAATLF
jgi:glutathione S-transferase